MIIVTEIDDLAPAVCRVNKMTMTIVILGECNALWGERE